MKRKISILVLVIVLIMTGCGKKKDKNEDKVNEKNEPIINTEDKVIEEKELENGIVAKNTSLKEVDGETTIVTSITNEGEQEIYIKYVDIIFKNEKDEEIKTVIGYIGENILPGKSYEIETGLMIDVLRVKSIEYKINY